MKVISKLYTITGLVSHAQMYDSNAAVYEEQAIDSCLPITFEAALIHVRNINRRRWIVRIEKRQSIY